MPTRQEMQREPEQGRTLEPGGAGFEPRPASLPLCDLGMALDLSFLIYKMETVWVCCEESVSCSM